MPGIDFRQARAGVRLAEVLDLLAFALTVHHGDQVRGPCPVHGSRTPGSRTFAAHLGKNVWHCFGCGAGGNALDLWMAVTRQPLYAAVLELFKRLGRDVPWLPGCRVGGVFGTHRSACGPMVGSEDSTHPTGDSTTELRIMPES